MVRGGLSPRAEDIQAGLSHRPGQEGATAPSTPISEPAGWGVGFGSGRPGFKSQLCFLLAVSLGMLLSFPGPVLSSGKQLTLLPCRFTVRAK